MSDPAKRTQRSKPYKKGRRDFQNASRNETRAGRFVTRVGLATFGATMGGLTGSIPGAVAGAAAGYAAGDQIARRMKTRGLRQLTQDQSRKFK